MKSRNIQKRFLDTYSMKCIRTSLILGMMLLCIFASFSLILSEPASATKFVPKTTPDMFNESDVIVNGTVLSIEDEVAFYPGIRRITIDVTGTEKGATADTISIIQLNFEDDPTQIYPYNAVFSIDEDVRVHLVNISDTNFVYDWDGTNTTPIPPGDNYWVHQGYNGKEPFQIPPVKVESIYSSPCCAEDHKTEKCCILLDFAADAFDDGYKNGAGKDLNFTPAQKTQIKNKIVDKVKADYTIPNCPIVVTTNPADCKDATFQMTVKVGGNSGNKKTVDANGTRTTDDSFGFAPDSKPGNGCITGKNVYVYTQEFGFEDGKEDWADTVEEMAQAVANVAAHEAGHQFGLSHDKDNDLPNGKYNNDDRPDEQLMVNGQDDISKLGTVDQDFTAGDIKKIKECCCPVKVPSLTPFGIVLLIGMLGLLGIFGIKRE